LFGNWKSGGNGWISSWPYLTKYETRQGFQPTSRGHHDPLRSLTNRLPQTPHGKRGKDQVWSSHGISPRIPQEMEFNHFRIELYYI
jgi:hypothetical protein